MTLSIDQPVWYTGADAQPGSIAAREGVVHASDDTLTDIRFGNVISVFPTEHVIPAVHDFLCESDALTVGNTHCDCRRRTITGQAPTDTDDRDRDALRAAIGYDPVRVSIAGHPEITETYRTAIDRDDLIERVIAAGFRLQTGQ